MQSITVRFSSDLWSGKMPIKLGIFAFSLLHGASQSSKITALGAKCETAQQLKPSVVSSFSASQGSTTRPVNFGKHTLIGLNTSLVGHFSGYTLVATQCLEPRKLLLCH